MGEKIPKSLEIILTGSCNFEREIGKLNLVVIRKIEGN
jgi:hypothetical protein